MFNVAIDGPAGAGKSTIAKMVAKKLGFTYVDTGSMYRAMALACIRAGLKASDEVEVCKVCEGLDVSLEYDENGAQQVILNGENVNAYIRTEEVGNMTSAIAVYGPVREKLVELQRKLGTKYDVIMDGRDIGTCVLKDAPVKIYLTASSRTRAERRYKELTEKGVDCNLDDIEKDIIDRDYRDMNREISPLKQAEDAILVDSSNMGIDEVVNELVRIIEEAR
ncbi:MAG: (d)CMP kinase [Lachnospiraceae bacterium]|nr:(d)CMP kinase [Lachnospiraceae bacterium]MEE0685967.1 (d)CMP kinase [Lachnospiraceae bacterium]MEE0862066.1 (d)CMP kinase [Lachnospiraceae bacterium]